MPVFGRSNDGARIHAKRRFTILHLLPGLHSEFGVAEFGTGRFHSFQASILSFILIEFNCLQTESIAFYRPRVNSRYRLHAFR